MLILSMLGAWVFLGERPGRARLLGVAVILAGVVLIGAKSLAAGDGPEIRHFRHRIGAQVPDRPVDPGFGRKTVFDAVAAAFDRAVGAGAKPVQRVRDEPWGQTTSYVSDPNGYLVEICSPVQSPSAG